MSKTILITGTSNGFGNDIAKTLAAAGHRVFATMRDLNGRHSEAARDLNSKGIETIELDVTDDASVDAAFKTLFDKTGGMLDVLINNAGIAAGGIQETFTPEQTRAMFDVNVFGIQRVVRAALPSMHKVKAGLIVNIGSILGRVTLPFFALYGASKHAVEAVTEGYRYELSQQGIDVVLIQPGPYPTKLYTAIQKPADVGRAESYGDLPKLQTGFEEFLGGLFSSEGAPDPHDVAKAIVELVAQPNGQRPNRVVVGLDFGAIAVNTAIQPLQAKLVTDIGMQHLDALKSN
ncbi:SDR family oxidoreductase [Paraburkholderia sp. 32]|uniref:SDR family oxidoreductase n=1 Tax=Paraburkholderia sp. 32 TaxID=2991057 RepID=UPI003D208EF2